MNCGVAWFVGLRLTEGWSRVGGYLVGGIGGGDVLGVEDGGEDLVDGHLEAAEARRQTVLEVEVAVQQVQQQIVTCASYFINILIQI
jgi:hypothetical protein